VSNLGRRFVGVPSWLIFQSLFLAVLLGGFCLLPFAHLWGTLPQPPIADNGPSDPAASLPQAALGLVLFGVPSLLPFVLYRYRPATGLGRALPWLACLGAGLLVLLPAGVSLSSYPCCTSDVLDYVNRQRLWGVYGGNPFSAVPDQYPQDWTYAFTSFKQSVVSYGPAWWLGTRLFTQAAATLDQYLIGFKVLAAVCYAASLVLVWRLTHDREDRLQRLVFFAWHPVLLIDGLVRLHNDLLTVPLVLGACWLYRRGRPGPGVAAIGLAALVKLTVAPVAAPLIVSLVRARRWRELSLGLAACALLAVGLYGPFWFGPGTLLPMLQQAGRPQWSLGAALLYVLGSDSQLGVRLLLLAAWCGVAGVCLWRQAGRPKVDQVAATAAVVLLAGLLTLPLALYSHYLMPVVALAAVASDARIRSLVLAVSVGTVINAILGADSLAGGLTGDALDTLGSGIVLGSLIVGLVLARRGQARLEWPAWPAPSRSTYEPATPEPA
jgi:hypothetical protein